MLYMHYARACLFLFMVVAYAWSAWTWIDVVVSRARAQRTYESIGNTEMAKAMDVRGARVCVMAQMLMVSLASAALTLQIVAIVDAAP